MSETTADLVEAVREMRRLQREYFKTRSERTLTDAKRAERRVDLALRAHDQAKKQPALPFEER